MSNRHLTLTIAKYNERGGGGLGKIGGGGVV